MIMVQDRLSATHSSMVTGVTCLTRRWEARVAAGPYSEAEPMMGVVRVCSCYPSMVLLLSDGVALLFNQLATRNIAQVCIVISARGLWAASELLYFVPPSLLVKVNTPSSSVTTLRVLGLSHDL